MKRHLKPMFQRQAGRASSGHEHQGYGSSERVESAALTPRDGYDWLPMIHQIPARSMPAN